MVGERAAEAAVEMALSERREEVFCEPRRAVRRRKSPEGETDTLSGGAEQGGRSRDTAPAKLSAATLLAISPRSVRPGRPCAARSTASLNAVVNSISPGASPRFRPVAAAAATESGDRAARGSWASSQKLCTGAGS